MNESKDVAQDTDPSAPVPTGANTSQQVATGSDRLEQVATGAHLFGDWLTIEEAVAYCLSKGLNRTPKTIRKWAQRSRDTNSVAEIKVKSQDTENGFRWLIERDSLDVKIEQEKQFALRRSSDDGANTSAPVPTGAHTSEQVATGAHPSEPVRTSSDDVMAGGAADNSSDGRNLRGDENPDAAFKSTDRNSSDEIVVLLKTELDRAHKQIDMKDQQISALLERDRETNILIQGLQSTLSNVANALPSGRRAESESAIHEG